MTEWMTGPARETTPHAERCLYLRGGEGHSSRPLGGPLVRRWGALLKQAGETPSNQPVSHYLDLRKRATGGGWVGGWMGIKAGPHNTFLASELVTPLPLPLPPVISRGVRVSALKSFE